MVKACLQKRFTRDSRLVFTVPLPGREPVFMSMNIADDGRDNYGVVIVDAQKLLALWRAEPYGRHKNVSDGTPETWPSDYKYKYAAECFSHGRENPVPLADVSLEHRIVSTESYKLFRLVKAVRKERINFLTISDGITRTIWLLSHHCSAFPVKCRSHNVTQLYEAAGAAGAPCRTIQEWAELSPQA